MPLGLTTLFPPPSGAFLSGEALLSNGLLGAALLGVTALASGLCLLRLTRHRNINIKQANSLRESEAWYRQIFDATSEALFIHEPSGRICDVNERACTLYGFTRQQALSLSVGDISASTAPFNQAGAAAKLAAALQQGPQTFEWHARRLDGHLFWVETSLRACQIAGEQRIIASVRDISARRELEQRLARSQRLEAVGTLVSGVAHELNNILTPMMMSSSVLKDRMSNPEDRELLKLLETGARRGAAIVNQLITFCSGTTGSRIPIHPGELIRDIAFLMREPAHPGLQIIENIPESLWFVEAEPTQLHQMLLILATNARDAMPDGGTLTLSAENVPPQSNQPASDRQVLFSVCDTGSGIPPEIQNRIFDPFFTTKEVGKGVGLGLSTLHGIVKSYGGHITFETNQPRGTRFRVYLPAYQENKQLELGV